MKLIKVFLPSVFTIMNLFSGYLAIIQIMNDRYVIAAWLIVLAAVFDALDGKIARFSETSSLFGIEFDSLADIISFCLAPSILVYRVYAGDWIISGALLSFMPLLFGGIRLARFNIIARRPFVKSFIGLPTTAGALCISSFLLFNYELTGNWGNSIAALPLIVILSLLMLSNVEYDKLPIISFNEGIINNIKLGFFFASFISVLIFKGLALFPVSASYIIFGVIRWAVRHARAEEEAIDASVSE